MLRRKNVWRQNRGTASRRRGSPCPVSFHRPEHQGRPGPRGDEAHARRCWGTTKGGEQAYVCSSTQTPTAQQHPSCCSASELKQNRARLTSTERVSLTTRPSGQRTCLSARNHIFCFDYVTTGTSSSGIFLSKHRLKISLICSPVYLVVIMWFRLSGNRLQKQNEPQNGTFTPNKTCLQHYLQAQAVPGISPRVFVGL